MHLSLRWLRLLSVLRRWTVVVDSLFMCPSLFVVLCLVHYFVSFLGLHSYGRGRESWLLCFTWICLSESYFWMCSVAPPRDAVGWSAVCDCGISWSYSLTFCCMLITNAHISLCTCAPAQADLRLYYLLSEKDNRLALKGPVTLRRLAPTYVDVWKN